MKNRFKILTILAGVVIALVGITSPAFAQTPNNTPNNECIPDDEALAVLTNNAYVFNPLSPDQVLALLKSTKILDGTKLADVDKLNDIDLSEFGVDTDVSDDFLDELKKEVVQFFNADGVFRGFCAESQATQSTDPTESPDDQGSLPLTGMSVPALIIIAVACATLGTIAVVIGRRKGVV